METLINYRRVLQNEKKETLVQVFSCEFREISENTFFTEHLWTTAPDYMILACQDEIATRRSCIPPVWWSITIFYLAITWRKFRPSQA